MGDRKKLAAVSLLLCLALSHICIPQKVFAAARAAAIQTGARIQSGSQTGWEYTIQTDKEEYKDDKGRVRGIVSYSYPQFDGTSEAVKKINRQLKKKSRSYFKSDNAQTIKESTQYSIQESRFYDETEQYYWTTACSVSYNKNGIVSFYMLEDWYAGGVHNRSEYGLNYNLNTGKKLTLNDVIAGNARKEMLKAAKTYCGTDLGAYEIIKKTRKYKFYFEKGKVYICYGSYELNHGTSWDSFAVKGKY